jgi:hypothetical protein
MKKLLSVTALVGVIGCHATPVTTHVSPTSAGAATPTGAIQLYLDAVRSGDLQAMALVWGTKQGPARNSIPAKELEEREVVMQGCFNHDSYSIVGPAHDPTGGRAFKVQLTRGDRSRTMTVSTIQGPGERWYVQNLDIAAVRDFCGSGIPSKP